ncbi:Cytochrome c-type biogenesis protein CcmE [compost metagenome]
MVAQGVLGEGNVVNAREVLAKHDEKYTPPEVADAMKENHKGPASAYATPQNEGAKS